MKDINIWCVEFKGNDGKWHQETSWHTSRKFCEEYISYSEHPETLRLQFANLCIDK